MLCPQQYHAHSIPRRLQWHSHSIITVFACYPYIVPMVFPFLSEHSHSISTALPKHSHGVHIGFPWYYHSFEVEVFPHHSQTVQMLLPQYSSLQSAESIPMMFAHIIPMLFLWFSHALPMPFLEHSHAISSQSRSILMILLAYSHMLFPHPIALPEYSHAFLPKCSQSIPIAFPQHPQRIPMAFQ